MRRTNSFKSTSAYYRARQLRRRDARERTEDREWAAKSGPVRIYHVPPESLRDRSGEYGASGTAGGRVPLEPAA